MTISSFHDCTSAAVELREQLATDKRRIAFFMGAGCSMAVGLPGIAELTQRVKESLDDKHTSLFELINGELCEDSNVEDVLNRVRLYRELLSDNINKTHNALSGIDMKNLDSAICRAIHTIVSEEPPMGNTPYKTFAQWLYTSYSMRQWPTEIFTTNYDLLLEKAMEEVGVPHFDGFVGSVNPFFAPESVGAEEIRLNEWACPPRSWTRLWKLHGSVNWCVRKVGIPEKKRVTRLSEIASPADEELMIFPSRDKYIDSRRLPFIAYHDRLRKFVLSGEAVLFIVGYSFSDEHLNEIVFQGLRGNNRLAVNVFVYGLTTEIEGKKVRKLPESIIEFGKMHRNLSIYGPDKVVIGGVVKNWAPPSDSLGGGNYWSEDGNHFTLGDFAALTSYLEHFIGIGSKSKTSYLPKEGPGVTDNEK